MENIMEETKTKRRTLGQALGLFWQGLTGMITGVVDGIATILGMRDESRYGRVIRRIVGSCFAVIMSVFAVVVVRALVEECVDWWHRSFGERAEIWRYSERYLSREATYFHGEYGDMGFVRDKNGRKTLDGVAWIAKPLGTDSLVCYSDGEKRGYFNMFTGEVVIEPRYDRAWIFSDGLAAVENEGWIRFIDCEGNVVIDKGMPYESGMEGYVFHNGHCVVRHDSRERVGLIDKQGEWALAPNYTDIQPVDTFWIVSDGEEQAVLTAGLKTVLPLAKASYLISEGAIFATMHDHSLRKYDLQGNVIDAFCVRKVERLIYPTEELRYNVTRFYDDEDNLVSEVEHDEAVHVPGTARCMRYEAETGWYGVLAPDGRVVTSPAYRSIEAIGADCYLCKNGEGYGVILNGKGERVR